MSTASLILVSGLFLALMAVVAAWLFKTASAPFFLKIVIPISLMVLACATPYQLPSILGWPVETAFASLPQQAELISFVPRDADKKVDLWLVTDGPPRAYEVTLTDGLKDTLRQAQKAQAAGQRTMLAKAGKPGVVKRPGYMDIDGGQSPYTLLPNAFHLPSKDGAE